MSKSKQRCALFNTPLLKRLFLLVVFVLLAYVYITQENLRTADLTTTAKFSLVKSYLINTTNCKIPYVDPFNEEVSRFIRKVKYESCSNKELLTYIERRQQEVALKVRTGLFPLYSFSKITCCYSNITRHKKKKFRDTEIQLTSCEYFETEVTLYYPYIYVRCTSLMREVYANVHAAVLPKSNRENNEQILPSTELSNSSYNTSFSVLLVGIDSISKQNLIRTMPKTYKYLEEHFVNLKGYNKVADNTFPNLMAILSGKDRHQLEVNCTRKDIANKCNFIWNLFKQYNYTTAYAEDEVHISTYNYDRPGFDDPPTDYYYRPYFIASQKRLPVRLKSGMSYCTGPENTGERILNAAKDFSVALSGHPSFGLFWTNSFSHEDINCPSSMDVKVLEFLTDKNFRASLENTILIFFSDHGFRFGDIRNTYTGWLEERLPFIYIRVPKSFKITFPDHYNNLLVNSKRLTTPYDLHMTLQDILKLSQPNYKIIQASACPKCQSLFKQIYEKRNCQDCGIDSHYCTCITHTYISTVNPLVQKAAKYVLNFTNKLVKSFSEGNLCATYEIGTIRYAGISENYNGTNKQIVNNYLLSLEFVPKASFEATVLMFSDSDNNSFSIEGEISRIDKYGANSLCVTNSLLKKYCYCDSVMLKVMTVLCNFFYC